MTKDSNVVPLVNQKRTLPMIRSAAQKFLRVWTRNNPPNMAHADVHLMIQQLPDQPNYGVNLRHNRRETGDLSATANPDDECYYVSESYSFFGKTIERFLKGFCFERTDNDPCGTVVQSAREETK